MYTAIWGYMCLDTDMEARGHRISCSITLHLFLNLGLDCGPEKHQGSSCLHIPLSVGVIGTTTERWAFELRSSGLYSKYSYILSPIVSPISPCSTFFVGKEHPPPFPSTFAFLSSMYRKEENTFKHKLEAASLHTWRVW